MTKDEVVNLDQEQLRKEAEERKMRSEQARMKKEEMKQKQLENVSRDGSTVITSNITKGSTVG